MTKERTRLRRAIEDVPGWLFEREAWRLHELARRAATADPDAPIVEIGSFHGRSTIALAMGVEAGDGRAPVYTIDPQEDDRHRALLANVERAGVGKRVEPVRATSSEARRALDDIRAGLLFIDGSHEYEDVLADLDRWTELLRPGAVVAINDPFWPGVNRALRERVAHRKSPYRQPGYLANTVFVRYLPEADWTARDSAQLSRLRLVLRAGAAWYARYHARVLSSARVPARLRPVLVWPPVWVLSRAFGLLLPARPGRPRG